MKKILLGTIFFLLVLQGISQQSFRLHVQPGKPQLAGDGDDYTTLVITARDNEGEILSSINGKVAVRISSGFCDQSEVKMQNGVAMVKYTSPMFGTPIKASQRMVYFIFKFMQKFVARSAGSADEAANRKLATDITLETFKEGLNPLSLIPSKDGDNFAYIVCEINGVKGKAKIEILKASEGRNGNIFPGVYYGRDITGQSEWMLDITHGGEGYFGEANASSKDQVAILFSNEEYTEFNDAMGKMAGMTGFKKAYLGPPASEQKYYENYDIRTNGMSSAYMPMPNHGVFVYIPPILFEYAGQRQTKRSAGSDKEEVKTEKTGIVLTQDKIIGDGRSRTKAVFHFEDENGRPVAGKTVSWTIPKELKVLSMETVTNESGNALVEIEAPVIKATEEKRGDNWKEVSDNIDLFYLKASYSSLSDKSQTTETKLIIYKTLEQDLYVLKPGMEVTPYKILLPQLEYYNLESSIYALLPESFMTVPNKKTPVNDAVVFLTSRNFDKAEFQKNYDVLFKKDREMFLMLLENEKGGFTAVTDVSGKFKLVIRDFESKRWLDKGNYERTLAMEPMEAKIADLTGRRKGALTEVLDLLAGGDAAVTASQDAGESASIQSIHALSFKEKVLAKLLVMENDLCSGKHQEAVYIEEKLHIIGMLMTNMKGSSRYVRDCAKTFGTQSYEALKFLVFYAAEKYKFNEKVGKWIGNTQNGQKLKDAGVNAAGYVDTYLVGLSKDEATKTLVQQFLIKTLTDMKKLPSQEYFQLLGHAANYALSETQKDMLDAVVNAVVYYLPFPDKIADNLIAEYYAGQTAEVLKMLNQDPAKVHAVYEKLQPALRDRSTEIRQQYTDVAAWRLSLDNFKAYTDLSADLFAKGAVILVDAYTQNYAAIQKHLEYIDKAKNVLNAAYHAASVGLEFQSFRNLWAESDAVLIYANKCIDQGLMNPVTENRNFSFPLFPSAMAASLPPAEAIAGVPVIGSNELLLSNGRLPVAALNKLYNGYPAFDNWFTKNDGRLQYLSVSFPEEFMSLASETENYRNNLLGLTVMMLARIDNPQDAQIAKQWNDLAAKVTVSSAQLLKTAGTAVDKMQQLPDNPSVGSLNTNKTSTFDDKTIIYVVAGIGLLALTLLMVFIIRRKRKSAKRQVVNPAAVATFVVQPPAQGATPSAQPTSNLNAKVNSVSPKFCPQCGSQLASSTKFCGKCGFKILS